MACHATAGDVLDATSRWEAVGSHRSIDVRWKVNNMRLVLTNMTFLVLS
jgi:hypothetical protein